MKTLTEITMLTYILVVFWVILMITTGTLYNIWRNGREYQQILIRIFSNPFFYLFFLECYFWKYYIFAKKLGINTGVGYDFLVLITIVFILVTGRIIQIKFFRRTTLFLIHE